MDERFWNQCFDKSRLKNFVLWFFSTHGEHQTVSLLESLKTLGFEYATKAGISLGIDDLKIPPKKNILMAEAEKLTQETEIQYKRGEITGVERFQRLIDTWHRTSENLKQEVIDHFKATDILNPVYMMAFSGARGNISQVRQLVGMRGLMSDPQGQILDFPIRSNFREGLTLTEYIISCYGARKGIVDTALRTANAGYLTRRLVDVAQHVIVASLDCGTKRGVLVTDMKEGNKTIYSLKNRIIGRVLAQDVGTIGFRNQEISTNLAIHLTKSKSRIYVRSPLTCESHDVICQLCYGWSLSQGNLVSIGEVVGIIAAQSIGEPGTQLTMRTFHTGGVFSGDVTEQIKAPVDGIAKYPRSIPGTMIRTSEGKIAFLTKSDGIIAVEAFQTEFEQNLSSILKIYKIPPFSVLFVRNGERVFSKQVIAQISNIGKNQFKRKETERCIKTEFDGEVVFSNLKMKELLLVVKKIGEEALVKKIKQALRKGPEGPKKSEKWTSGYVLSGQIYRTPIPANFFPKEGDFIGQTLTTSNKGILNGIKWFFPKFGTSPLRLDLPLLLERQNDSISFIESDSAKKTISSPKLYKLKNPKLYSSFNNSDNNAFLSFLSTNSFVSLKTFLYKKNGYIFRSTNKELFFLGIGLVASHEPINLMNNDKQHFFSFSPKLFSDKNQISFRNKDIFSKTNMLNGKFFLEWLPRKLQILDGGFFFLPPLTKQLISHNLQTNNVSSYSALAIQPAVEQKVKKRIHIASQMDLNSDGIKTIQLNIDKQVIPNMVVLNKERSLTKPILPTCLMNMLDELKNNSLLNFSQNPNSHRLSELQGNLAKSFALNESDSTNLNLTESDLIKTLSLSNFDVNNSHSENLVSQENRIFTKQQESTKISNFLYTSILSVSEKFYKITNKILYNALVYGRSLTIQKGQLVFINRQGWKKFTKFNQEQQNPFFHEFFKISYLPNVSKKHVSDSILDSFITIEQKNQSNLLKGSNHLFLLKKTFFFFFKDLFFICKKKNYNDFNVNDTFCYAYETNNGHAEQLNDQSIIDTKINNNFLSELVLLCKQSSNKMLHKGEPRFKLLCLHTATKAKQSNNLLQKGFALKDLKFKQFSKTEFKSKIYKYNFQKVNQKLPIMLNIAEQNKINEIQKQHQTYWNKKKLTIQKSNALYEAKEIPKDISINIVERKNSQNISLQLSQKEFRQSILFLNNLTLKKYNLDKVQIPFGDKNKLLAKIFNRIANLNLRSSFNNSIKFRQLDNSIVTQLDPLTTFMDLSKLSFLKSFNKNKLSFCFPPNTFSFKRSNKLDNDQAKNKKRKRSLQTIDNEKTITVQIQKRKSWYYIKNTKSILLSELQANLPAALFTQQSNVNQADTWTKQLGFDSLSHKKIFFPGQKYFDDINFDKNITYLEYKNHLINNEGIAKSNRFKSNTFDVFMNQKLKVYFHLSLQVSAYPISRVKINSFRYFSNNQIENLLGYSLFRGIFISNEILSFTHQNFPTKVNIEQKSVINFGSDSFKNEVCFSKWYLNKKSRFEPFISLLSELQVNLAAALFTKQSNTLLQRGFGYPALKNKPIFAFDKTGFLFDVVTEYNSDNYADVNLVNKYIKTFFVKSKKQPFDSFSCYQNFHNILLQKNKKYKIRSTTRLKSNIQTKSLKTQSFQNFLSFSKYVSFKNSDYFRPYDPQNKKTNHVNKTQISNQIFTQSDLIKTKSLSNRVLILEQPSFIGHPSLSSDKNEYSTKENFKQKENFGDQKNVLSELVLLCKQSSNKMLHKGEPRFKLLCLHTATKAKQSNILLQKGFGYPALKHKKTKKSINVINSETWKIFFNTFDLKKRSILEKSFNKAQSKKLAVFLLKKEQKIKKFSPNKKTTYKSVFILRSQQNNVLTSIMAVKTKVKTNFQNILKNQYSLSNTTRNVRETSSNTYCFESVAKESLSELQVNLAAALFTQQSNNLLQKGFGYPALNPVFLESLNTSNLIKTLSLTSLAITSLNQIEKYNETYRKYKLWNFETIQFFVPSLMFANSGITHLISENLRFSFLNGTSSIYSFFLMQKYFINKINNKKPLLLIHSLLALFFLKQPISCDLQKIRNDSISILYALNSVLSVIYTGKEQIFSAFTDKKNLQKTEKICNELLQSFFLYQFNEIFNLSQTQKLKGNLSELQVNLAAALFTKQSNILLQREFALNKKNYIFDLKTMLLNKMALLLHHSLSSLNDNEGFSINVLKSFNINPIFISFFSTDSGFYKPLIFEIRSFETEYLEIKDETFLVNDRNFSTKQFKSQKLYKTSSDFILSQSTHQKGLYKSSFSETELSSVLNKVKLVSNFSRKNYPYFCLNFQNSKNLPLNSAKFFKNIRTFSTVDLFNKLYWQHDKKGLRNKYNETSLVYLKKIPLFGDTQIYSSMYQTARSNKIKLSEFNKMSSLTLIKKMVRTETIFLGLTSYKNKGNSQVDNVFTNELALAKTSFLSPFEGEILKLTKNECLLLSKKDQLSFYHSFDLNGEHIGEYFKQKKTLSIPSDILPNRMSNSDNIILSTSETKNFENSNEQELTFPFAKEKSNIVNDTPVFITEVSDTINQKVNKIYSKAVGFKIGPPNKIRNLLSKKLREKNITDTQNNSLLKNSNMILKRASDEPRQRLRLTESDLIKTNSLSNNPLKNDSLIDNAKNSQTNYIFLGDFLVYGDTINSSILAMNFILTSKTLLKNHSRYALKTSGQIIHLNKSKITLRRAQPILFSPKALLHSLNGAFVEKNTPLLTLPYQVLTTGDIVQGIPKIEQLFEARTTKNGRLFKEGIPNLLIALYKRFKTRLPLEQAVRQSFYKIQQILIDAVQRVYRSQGVTIADKHIEIIVKQMTSKVLVSKRGQTGFLPGELLDIDFVEKINNTLIQKIRYEPILLGITRASLEVDSFLSAASFQQTTKVLSQAAISKKKDFLKGLKENVIVGNLIPAGTGSIKNIAI